MIDPIPSPLIELSAGDVSSSSRDSDVAASPLTTTLEERGDGLESSNFASGGNSSSELQTMFGLRFNGATSDNHWEHTDDFEAAVHCAQAAYLHALEDAVQDGEYSAFLAQERKRLTVARSDEVELSSLYTTVGSDGHIYSEGSSFSSSAVQVLGRSVASPEPEQAKLEAHIGLGTAGCCVNHASPVCNPETDAWVNGAWSAEGSSPVDLELWLDHSGRRFDYAGRGYGLTISQFVHSRVRTDTFATAGARVKLKGSMLRRLRRELRTEEGDPFHLGFEAFKDQGGARSFVLSDAEYSAVDSGTAVTIARDGTSLVGFDGSSSIRIVGFNGSMSRSAGAGRIVGFTYSRQGRRVTLRVPDAHVVPGAPMDLLSVSALIANGFEFHFTKAKSWIVTPEMDILDLVERSGLFWLKWFKAKDPKAALIASRAARSGKIEAVSSWRSAAQSEKPRVRAETEVVRSKSGNRLTVVGSKTKGGETAPLKSDSRADDTLDVAKEAELCSAEEPRMDLQPAVEVGSWHPVLSEVETSALCVESTAESSTLTDTDKQRNRAENEVVRSMSGNRSTVVGSKAKGGETAPLKSDSLADDADEAMGELCSTEGPHLDQQQAGSYWVAPVGSGHAACVCYSCNSMVRERERLVPLSLLHRRLGHPSLRLIEDMVKNRSIDVGLSDRKHANCDVCKANKLTRSSVPKERESDSTVIRPFERVWTDLKGKLLKDFWGNEYLVTFTCEVTRWTCVYFCQKKSQVKDRFLEFLSWVKCQGHVVRELNSDGGGEYTGNENAKVLSDFQRICVDNGIVQRFTSPDTSAQNGVSERLNRTLVEHARTVLHEAGLAREFWSLAVKHIAWLRNRTWHSALKIPGGPGVSPFQVLYGRTPRISMARVFGCDVWRLDLSVKKGTFEPKGKKGIFVGLSAQRKGWLIFDPKTRKVRTSFHCTFDESLEGRRCALRDFDLRQKKAGPGATRDDERLALLERETYDLNVDFHLGDDLAEGFIETKEPRVLENHDGAGLCPTPLPGSVDAKDSPFDGAGDLESPQRPELPTAPRSEAAEDRPGLVDDDSDAESDHHGESSSRGGAPREIAERGGAGLGPESSRIEIPKRRAAIGSPQELDEQDAKFLEFAFTHDCRCTCNNVTRNEPIPRHGSDTRSIRRRGLFGRLRIVVAPGVTSRGIMPGAISILITQPVSCLLTRPNTQER